jgi:penicillin-binding protein 1A
MRKFTYEGEQLVEMSPIDSIEHHTQLLNAGFVTMDPVNGAIKAWVGGINHNFFQYDHVKTSTKRQVGSIFKPFVYATAVEQGADPCELIRATREVYLDEEGRKYSPRNMQNDYDVEYTMRGAIAYSVNTLAVKWIDRVGINKTIKLARNAGITSDLEEIPGIALGSSSISLYEMTAAFACFVNDGVAVDPFYLASVSDSKGHIIYQHQDNSSNKRVMSTETAQLVLQLLETVIREGTGARIRWKYGVLNEMAGKTGTSQGNADGWFVGLTPTLVGGSWVGGEDARIRFQRSDIGQGSNTALPIFAYFMKQVNQDPEFKSAVNARFPRPKQSVLEKLSCDLYELDSALQVKIERMIFVQDSLVSVDTLNRREDMFIEKLYKRKLRMQQAAQLDSTTLKELKDVGG